MPSCFCRSVLAKQAWPALRVLLPPYTPNFSKMTISLAPNLPASTAAAKPAKPEPTITISCFSSHSTSDELALTASGESAPTAAAPAPNFKNERLVCILLSPINLGLQYASACHSIMREITLCIGRESFLWYCSRKCFFYVSKLT